MNVIYCNPLFGTTADTTNVTLVSLNSITNLPCPLPSGSNILTDPIGNSTIDAPQGCYWQANCMYLNYNCTDPSNPYMNITMPSNVTLLPSFLLGNTSQEDWNATCQTACGPLGATTMEGILQNYPLAQPLKYKPGISCVCSSGMAPNVTTKPASWIDVADDSVIHQACTPSGAQSSVSVGTTWILAMVVLALSF